MRSMDTSVSIQCAIGVLLPHPTYSEKVVILVVGLPVDLISFYPKVRAQSQKFVAEYNWLVPNKLFECVMYEILFHSIIKIN